MTMTTFVPFVMMYSSVLLAMILTEGTLVEGWLPSRKGHRMLTGSIHKDRENSQEMTLGHLAASLATSLSMSSSSSALGGYIENENNDVTANDLSSIKVMNADGVMVPLGQAMGSDETTIVVFLRHLGCTWCWSHVYQWSQVPKEELNGANIKGPIFVSIGDQDRLNAFLEKHPNMNRDQFFVDGFDFAAYKQAGFGRFDEKPAEVTEGVSNQPVQLGGFDGWMTYLKTFAPLAPFTEEMGFLERFSPEGLLWVGGTFIVSGNDIAYRWDDRTSGDHPNVADVVAFAKEVAARK